MRKPDKNLLRHIFTHCPGHATENECRIEYYSKDCPVTTSCGFFCYTVLIATLDVKYSEDTLVTDTRQVCFPVPINTRYALMLTNGRLVERNQ
jgi:hypothetical protein